jgi:hypothetical protein
VGVSAIEGSCLCKAVTFAVNAEFEHPPEVYHCQQCRKQTGGFFISVNIQKRDMRLRGDDHVVWDQSLQEVKRGFCGRCGSTLFWQPLKEDYEWIGVSAALFDSPLPSKIAKQTFVSEQGSYYDIADKVSQHLRY